MRLLRLAVTGFRNLAEADLELGTPYVVFHGDNAQGKTNALEAIHVLANLKALRGRRSSELVAWGGTTASVRGTVDRDGIERTLRVDLSSRARRIVRMDGQVVRSLVDYFDGFRAVAFTPMDLRVVAGEPKFRRAWLDRAAFTAMPAHLSAVRRVKRCLAQKAAALQHGPDSALLDALDDELARAGASLVQRRVQLLADLGPHVVAMYQRIARTGVSVELTYKTQTIGVDVEQRFQTLRQRLSEVRDDEVRRRRTLAGPQRDDVGIFLGGRLARTFGSRGQVRSLVLSLKLAEIASARDRGFVPPFLIDDVGSELDAGRMDEVVRVLAELGVQVFVTTTHPRHVASLPDADTMWVRVEGGRLDPGAWNVG